MAHDHIVVQTVWEDFSPLLPFRDCVDGKLKMCAYAERRRVAINGKQTWQKRERPETEEEWAARQW
jgi:hypothetical protein